MKNEEMSLENKDKNALRKDFTPMQNAVNR